MQTRKAKTRGNAEIWYGRKGSLERTSNTKLREQTCVLVHAHMRIYAQSMEMMLYKVIICQSTQTDHSAESRAERVHPSPVWWARPGDSEWVRVQSPTPDRLSQHGTPQKHPD